MVRLVAAAFAAAGILSGGPAPGQSASALTGRWELNRDATELDTSQKPKRSTLTIAQEKNTVRLNWSGVDADGKPDEGHLVYIGDRQEHPSTAPASSGIKNYRAHWEGGRFVLEKDGGTWTERDVFTVSNNGGRLSIERNHNGWLGGVTMKFVYDRAK